ncbi:protein gp37 [Agrobacterium vitis]|nr:protein gp37 [Agrobacterium vitis]
MGENTKIEWADHTFNPWIGCTKIGPACANCYAEDMMDKRYHRAHWGAGEDRVRTSDANWRDPFLWNKKAAFEGKIATVFCASLADVFDNEVDELWRWQLFKLIEETPNLNWLLLTKRIGNVIKMTRAEAGHRPLPPNAAIGATMANQPEYDRDAPKLAEVKARCNPLYTFGSLEPLLGGIKLDDNRPDWVIVGGERGRNSRPMHPDWVRSLRDQCAETGTPFMFKQWGEWSPVPWKLERLEGESDQSYKDRSETECSQFAVSRTGYIHEMDHKPWSCERALPQPDSHHAVKRLGKKKSGRLLDGVEHNGFPARRAV